MGRSLLSPLQRQRKWRRPPSPLIEQRGGPCRLQCEEQRHGPAFHKKGRHGPLAWKVKRRGARPFYLNNKGRRASFQNTQEGPNPPLPLKNRGALPFTVERTKGHPFPSKHSRRDGPPSPWKEQRTTLFYPITLERTEGPTFQTQKRRKGRSLK